MIINKITSMNTNKNNDKQHLVLLISYIFHFLNFLFLRELPSQFFIIYLISYIAVGLFLKYDTLFFFITGAIFFDIPYPQYYIAGISTGGINLLKSLLLIIFLFIKTPNQNKLIKNNSKFLTKNLLLFVVALTISLLYTSSVGIGVKFYLQISTALLWAFCLLKMPKHIIIKKVLSTIPFYILFSLVCSLVFSQISYFKPIFWQENRYLNEISLRMLSSRSTMGIMFVLTFNYFFIKQFRTSNKKKYYKFAMLLSLTGIILIGSRAAFISLFISIIFSNLSGRRKTLKFLFISAFISGLLFIILSLNIDYLNRNRTVRKIRNVITQDKTISELSEGRIGIYNITLHLIEESLLFGHGLGAEILVLKKWQGITKYSGTTIVHNEYLRILLIGGIMLLLSATILIVNLFLYSKTISNKDMKTLYLSVLYLFLIQCSFENVLSEYHNSLMLIFLYLFGISNISEKRLSTDERPVNSRLRKTPLLPNRFSSSRA